MQMLLSRKGLIWGFVWQEFQTNLNVLGPVLSDWQPEKRIRVMQMVVHCSDISNPAKPVRFCTEWSNRVLSEFFAQVCPHPVLIHTN